MMTLQGNAALFHSTHVRMLLVLLPLLLLSRSTTA
jgi:hypothetical protein